MATVTSCQADGQVRRVRAGERVTVVTHAGVISQVLGAIHGRAACIWEADRPEPLTATEVACQDGVPIAVLTYNVTDWY